MLQSKKKRSKPMKTTLWLNVYGNISWLDAYGKACIWKIKVKWIETIIKNKETFVT